MIKLVNIISNLSLGGAQILIFDILKYLKEKNKFDISVITIDSGKYIERFESAGITVIDLKKKGLINPGIYFEIVKAIKKLKPDIIHTHLNKADFYGRIAAKRCNVPIIISTCHNYSTTHKGADIDKKSIFDVIDNFVIKYSDCSLIAISEHVKKYLSNRLPQLKNEITTIYNGIDIGKEKYILNEEEQLKLRLEIGFDKDDFIICIAGRLEKQKGHLFFLNSVKEILHTNSRVKILIIGEGSMRNEIENYIAENSFTERIKLSGFVPFADKYFEISNVVAVPSFWEGFGLVLIEAMIKGKLVLASDTGGIPEIIDNFKNGILFKCGNEEDLKAKIKLIIGQEIDTELIRKNGIKTVKDKFDIKQTSELYYRFYLSKLNPKKSRTTNE